MITCRGAKVERVSLMPLSQNNNRRLLLAISKQVVWLNAGGHAPGSARHHAEPASLETQRLGGLAPVQLVANSRARAHKARPVRPLSLPRSFIISELPRGDNRPYRARGRRETGAAEIAGQPCQVRPGHVPKAMIGLIRRLVASCSAQLAGHQTRLRVAMRLLFLSACHQQLGRARTRPPRIRSSKRHRDTRKCCC